MDFESSDVNIIVLRIVQAHEFKDGSVDYVCDDCSVYFVLIHCIHFFLIHFDCCTFLQKVLPLFIAHVFLVGWLEGCYFLQKWHYWLWWWQQWLPHFHVEPLSLNIHSRFFFQSFHCSLCTCCFIVFHGLEEGDCVHVVALVMGVTVTPCFVFLHVLGIKSTQVCFFGVSGFNSKASMVILVHIVSAGRQNNTKKGALLFLVIHMLMSSASTTLISLPPWFTLLEE